MWHRVMSWSVVVLVVFLVGGGQGDDEKEDRAAKVMKRKLVFAHQLLEGIAVNDFKKVKTGAEGLIAASKEAAWNILPTPRYEMYSDEFRRSARDIIAAAEKNNTERAALAYVDLTLTCVKCHQHVREEGMGQLTPPLTLPRTRIVTASPE